MTTEEVKKKGVAEYAVMCCGVLYCIRHKKFKRCSRCGKILKDTTSEILDTTDKT